LCGASASSTSICRPACRTDGSSAGDGGNDKNPIALTKLVVISAKGGGVRLVDVNVHEAPHLPGIVAQMLVDRREALLDFAEQRRQRLRTAFDCLHPVSESPQR